MAATNYFRVSSPTGSATFFFDDGRAEDVEAAWEGVEKVRSALGQAKDVVACVYRTPRIPGPWSHLPIIGHST